jgi:hypothetical protein
MSAFLARKFEEYDRENPEIYEYFVKFTLQIADVKDRYSAKAIFEQIRWHTDIRGGKPFKISNNYTAYYARKFEQDHPWMKGFFRKREI